MLEIIGWIAGVAFAICAWPQVYKCWQQGHAHGLSYAFLALMTLGEVLTLIYVLGQNLTMSEKAPLLLNYIANILALVGIWYYRLFPRAEK